jgi:hypothetical protein
VSIHANNMANSDSWLDTSHRRYCHCCAGSFFDSCEKQTRREPTDEKQRLYTHGTYSHRLGFWHPRMASGRRNSCDTGDNLASDSHLAVPSTFGAEIATFQSSDNFTICKTFRAHIHAFAADRTDGFAVEVSNTGNCTARWTFDSMVKAIFVVASVTSYLCLFPTNRT